MMEGIVVVSVFFKMDRSRGAVVILLFSEGREALMESLPDESDFDNPQWGWIRNLGSSVGLFVIVGLDGFMVCAELSIYVCSLESWRPQPWVVAA
jgi:hypothetical protein